MRVLRGLSLALLVLVPASSLASGVELGGSLREQADYISDDQLGSDGISDRVWQHRLLGYADWQPTAVLRTYAELGVYAQDGRNGGSGPTDASALDLQQVYADWRPGADVLLRLGRQEWKVGSGRLVSLRDGPNIRRAFDGVIVDASLVGIQLSARWGRPVRNHPRSFDDRADEHQHLGGVQLTVPLDAAISAEFYGLDYARDRARFALGQADEERRSWGLRLFGKSERLDFNMEAVAQTGRWGTKDIRAWTLANDFGWLLSTAPYPLRLGLKADLASGDGDLGDDRLETFNALYPNPSYFSDAGLIAPANLMDLQPNLTVSLSHDTTVYLGWDMAWKQRKEDAVYSAPMPLMPVTGSTGGGRFIGHQLQFTTEHEFNRHLDLKLSYVWFGPSSALSGIQRGHIDFLQFVATLKF